MLGEYVSFSDSILFKLSKLSWKRGNDNFYIEKIPFSFSSGNEYASFCTNLVSSFSEIMKSPLRILECGSGNGIFAKKMITKLKLKNLQFNYTLTEFSHALIESYSEWISDLENVESGFLDILNPKDIVPYNVAILTYLLDTVPCKCLRFSKNQLFEQKVCITLKENAKLTNSFDFPFKDFTLNELNMFLNESIEDQQISLISRLQDIINIEWKQFPISVSEFEFSEILSEWLGQKENIDKDFYFNYSDHYFHIFNNLRHFSSSEFMFICYDFATPVNEKITQFDTLYGKFGACYFNNINFDLLKFYCNKHNLGFVSSNYPNAENQVAVITSVKNKRLLRLFDQQMLLPEPGVLSYNWVKKFDASKDVLSLHQLIKESQRELSEDALADYVYRFSLAKKFYSLLSYENALIYVDMILSDYGNLALDVLILNSKILRKQHYYKDALQLLNNVVDSTTYYELLYLELIFIYAELNDVSNFQKAIRLYFKHFTTNPQWQLAEMIK